MNTAKGMNIGGHLGSATKIAISSRLLIFRSRNPSEYKPGLYCSPWGPHSMVVMVHLKGLWKLPSTSKYGSLLCIAHGPGPLVFTPDLVCILLHPLN